MSERLPSLRETIAKYDLAAKKPLGQHFLLDLNLTRKIVRASGVKANDCVLEIGPGPGGLTRALVEANAFVFAVERDRRCIDALSELVRAFPDKLILFNEDALAIDEKKILGARAPVRIIANLPYNISTELLVKWLHEGEKLWRSMTLMFQREVADRILAQPGSKAYGRLSIIAQAAAAPRRAFNLPASAFTPPPKVASSVVHFELTRPAFKNIKILGRITHDAFGQRRKMLRSSLRALFSDRLNDALSSIGAEQTQRAEELSVAQYIELANYYARFKPSER